MSDPVKHKPVATPPPDKPEPTRTKSAPSTPSKPAPDRTPPTKRPPSGPSDASAGSKHVKPHPSAPSKSSPPSPTKSHPGAPTRTKDHPSTPSKGGSSAPTKSGAGAGPSKGSASAPTSNKPEVRDLVDRADKTKNDRRTWDPDAPLSDARNAHRTNTVEEMREALESDHDYNWLEGDLRLDSHGKPVMAHDADAEGDGLTLDEWLEIGRHGQRGMKMDVKEPEAIPAMMDAVTRSGIDDGHVMFNVQSGDLTPDQVRDMRHRFPNAQIAISPAVNDDGRYDEESLRPAIEAAEAAGGKGHHVSFPIRWDIADDSAVDLLERHGDVSIWTDRMYGTPDNATEEAKHLRDRGVTGVIDLGEPSSWYEKAFQWGARSWDRGFIHDAKDAVSTGWHGFTSGVSWGFNHAVDGLESLGDRALDFGGDVLDTGGDLLDGAGDLASDAGGVIKDGASHLPVVGGLFG